MDESRLKAETEDRDVYNSERALWSAVILQAIEDIFREPLKGDSYPAIRREHNRRDAKNWIFKQGSSFVTIFHEVNIEPEKIRNRINNMIFEG